MILVLERIKFIHKKIITWHDTSTVRHGMTQRETQMGGQWVVRSLYFYQMSTSRYNTIKKRHDKKYENK